MCQHLQICIVLASYRDDLAGVIAILAACALAAGAIDLDGTVPSLEELFLGPVEGAELSRAGACALFVQYAALIQLPGCQEVAGLFFITHVSSPACRLVRA